MYGPANTWARLGAASSPEGGEIDDFSDIFEIRHWVDNQAVQIGSLSVTPKLVCHPTESYGMRITDPSGATLVYSGDTGYCDALIDLARGADVFLCEASWTHSPSRPPKLHLSGTEAGRAAAQAGVGELLLTHIPPWTSREDVISEAKAEFDGPVHAVVCNEVVRCHALLSAADSRGPMPSDHRLGLARVQTRRRPARRRAASGAHHPRLHLPSRRIGVGGVRRDAG